MIELKELGRIALAIEDEPTPEKKRAAFRRIAAEKGWPDIFGEGALIDALVAADFAGLIEKPTAQQRAATLEAAKGIGEDGLPSRGSALIRLSQFRDVVGFADATIYRMVKAGRFPKPFMSSRTLRLWKTEDVREFLRVGPERWQRLNPVAAAN